MADESVVVMKSRPEKAGKDDILILTRSKSAAENALKQASRYLEEELKLTVNPQKTEVVNSRDGVKFLGMVIHTGHTRIREKKVCGLKEKVRKITRRKRLVANILQVPRNYRRSLVYGAE